MVAMTYTLDKSTGVFVRGGMGHAWLHGGVKSDGVTFLAGLGVEARIGRHVSLGPLVTYHTSALDPSNPGVTLSEGGWRESLWVLGAAITMRR